MGLARIKICDWWYGLTIQRRKEILGKYGARIQDASSTYSKLGKYSKSSVVLEFNVLVIEN